MSKQPRSPLVALRLAVGLSQRALALELGVTEHTVRNWERGRAEPRLSIPATKALCRVLKTPLHRLPDSFAPPQGREPHGDNDRIVQLTIE